MLGWPLLPLAASVEASGKLVVTLSAPLEVLLVGSFTNPANNRKGSNLMRVEFMTA